MLWLFDTRIENFDGFEGANDGFNTIFSQAQITSNKCMKKRKNTLTAAAEFNESLGTRSIID